MKKCVLSLLALSMLIATPQKVSAAQADGPAMIGSLVAGAVTGACLFVYSVKRLTNNYFAKVQTEEAQKKGAAFASSVNLHLELGELVPDRVSEDQLDLFARTATELVRDDVRAYVEHISNAIAQTDVESNDLHRQSIWADKHGDRYRVLQNKLGEIGKRKRLLKNRLAVFAKHEQFFRTRIVALRLEKNYQKVFESLGKPCEAERIQEAVKELGGNSCFTFVRIIAHGNRHFTQHMGNEDAFEVNYPATYKRTKELQMRLAYVHNTLADHPCYRNDYRKLTGNWPQRIPKIGLDQGERQVPAVVSVARQSLLTAQRAVRVALQQ